MAGRKRKTAGDKPALEFKSATLTVPLLSLLGNDMGEIARQLAKKVAQSPTFFHDSPLLIDLQALARQKLDIEVDVLIMLVREQGFLPVGIRGGTEAQHNDALMLNVPVLPLPTGRPARDSEADAEAEAPAAPPAGATQTVAEAAPAPAAAQSATQPAAQSATQSIPQANGPETAAPAGNKLITQPVRSGQRVYARGDLTVMATVSAGAEILAEGNIHVYGSLRGRALAGVRGDESSRIFCMDLQAELVSIAGIYQLRDDQQARPGRAVAISLENQALVVKEL